MDILIGGAWPYANGSLHIGHIAALLPGDVLARYHRAKGDKVFFVSGSDCHGTPVAIRARQEKKSPEEISDFYHNEFSEVFRKFGFSYDLYTKTSHKAHIEFVTEFHKKMYVGPYIYEKTSSQAYCEKCGTFLADRFVVGKCPSCGKDSKGDQCDFCGNVLEPENLTEPVCSLCGSPISFHNAKHLYVAISKMEDRLRKFINNHTNWRKNAISFSNRYIDEGLRDRAVTRSLDWGIDVPKEGFEDKKIYIWAENVLGYISASHSLCLQRGDDFKELWGENSKHYYVHGKDNIPFHTIILPALMIANGENWHLPDEIISSEYLTLEGRRISTSQNWAIWAKDIIDKYDADSLRYFFIANGPEKRDTDFSWREYVKTSNGELLGAYGNFINRSLTFICNYFDSKVPVGKLNEEVSAKIKNLYSFAGSKIENGSFKEAIDEIFEFIRFSNKYFDTEKPWITRTENVDACKDTLYNCVQIISNLSVLLNPFLPFSSAKIQKWLSLSEAWQEQYIKPGYEIPKPEILFQRLDSKVIELETDKLQKSKKNH